MQISHLKIFTNTKSNISRKWAPSWSDFLPNPHPMHHAKWMWSPTPLFNPRFYCYYSFQIWSLSWANLHSHFPTNTLLNVLDFPIPNPPKYKDVQVVCQSTGCIFFSSVIPLHWNSLYIFSGLLDTKIGIVNTGIE